VANPRTLTFQIDPELRGRLESETVRTGLSLSAVIRLRLLASYGVGGLSIPAARVRVSGPGRLHRPISALPAGARAKRRVVPKSLRNARRRS
jgi:hypothetical protein